MSVLSIKNLTKLSEGRTVLQSLSLELSEGEIIGLLGPKGAGKTTLLSLLAGMHTADSGFAYIGGQSCELGLSKLRTSCGVVLESAMLYGRMTAMENLSFLGKLVGMDGAAAKERASLLMHGLNIWQFRDLPVHKLANSAYKKLRVAASLVNNPKLILWDDVGLELDDRSICEIYDFLTDIVKEERACALISCEDGQYMDFCHSYAVLKGGSILAKGSLEDLMKAADVKLQAVLHTADGQLSLPGFEKDESGSYIRDIDGEGEMEALVRGAVSAGDRILEAVVFRPSIGQVYEQLMAKEVG